MATASGLPTTAANAVIDYSHGNTPANVPTGTHKLRLTTTAPSASAAGTEVVGGSYVAQTVAMNASSSASAGNTSLLTYSSMPATTVVGTDEFDSAGTPFRWWFAQLGTSRTTALGDTLTIAATTGYTTALTSTP